METLELLYVNDKNKKFFMPQLQMGDQLRASEFPIATGFESLMTQTSFGRSDVWAKTPWPARSCTKNISHNTSPVHCWVFVPSTSQNVLQQPYKDMVQVR